MCLKWRAWFETGAWTIEICIWRVVAEMMAPPMVCCLLWRYGEATTMSRHIGMDRSSMAICMVVVLMHLIGDAKKGRGRSTSWVLSRSCNMTSVRQPHCWEFTFCKFKLTRWKLWSDITSCLHIMSRLDKCHSQSHVPLYIVASMVRMGMNWCSSRGTPVYHFVWRKDSRIF